MPDIFSNLVAQSLSSSAGIQPLVSPLFAPAPLLVSDATLLPSNEQAAVAAETALFSVPPAIFADETTETFAMERPFQQTVAPEQRTSLPDLVPLAARQHPISIVSLRHLFHLQRPANDNMEPASPVSQLSVPAPTVDEPSSEDTHPFSLPQDYPVGTELSGSSAVNWPTHAQTRKTPPSDDVAATPEVSALPLSSALPPSLQSNFQPQQVVKKDDVTDQQASSMVHLQPTPSVNQPGPQQPDMSSRPLRRTNEAARKPQPDQHTGITHPPILPIVTPAQDMTPAITTPTSQETSETAHRRERLIASTAAAEFAERVSIPPALHSSIAADAQDATRISPKQGAEEPKEEFEVPPIRITIGRVVVRATPTAQPTPNQKRVLRPAQSLSAYLKQRERGSQ